MILTNKLLPVALIAALIGGSVGAFVMHSRNQPTSTDVSATEQSAYKTGFADGYNACSQTDNRGLSGSTVRPAQLVYRNGGRRASARRVYYDYRQSRGRTFWQKHRDKLTVAMGTGGGTLLGALIGGKRGAGIGALAGAGGSALYTYKLRNRNRRY